MLCLYLLRRHRPGLFEHAAHAAPYGLAAGFATTVANAAGPIMNLYLLNKRLPKEEFVATGAWFFFTVNLAKAPIYLWYGLISQRSLAFDAVLVPAVLAGSVAGRWIVRRIDSTLFEIVVVVFTGISILLLLRG
jgi:uncharacterized membrane protein YfcA